MNVIIIMILKLLWIHKKSKKNWGDENEKKIMEKLGIFFGDTGEEFVFEENFRFWRKISKMMMMMVKMKSIDTTSALFKNLACL